MDIWGVGIIMYMILNEGRHPFFSTRKEKDYFIQSVKEKARLVFKIENLNLYTWINLTSIFSEAQDIFQKFMTIDPKKRITAKEALVSPWMSQTQRLENVE